MKNLNRKKTIAIIYLVFVGLFIFCSAIGSYFFTMFEDKTAEAESQVDSFMQTYNSMTDKTIIAYRSVDEDLTSRARLYASAASQNDPAALEPRKYGSGYIVKVEGEELIVPDGFPSSTSLTADFFTEDSASWTPGDISITYARISGPFYYIEITEDAAKHSNREVDVDISDALSNLANANGCDYLYVETGDLTEQSAIYVGTNDYSEYMHISDTGLSGENIKDLNNNGSAIAMLNGSLKWIKLMRPEINGITVYVMMIMDLKNILIGSQQQSVMMLIIAMIILIALTVWVFSVYGTVRKDILNEEQRRMYNPKSMQRRMLTVLLASALIVFISSAFIISLDCLFIESSNEENLLEEYIDRLKGDENRTETTWENSQSRYINTARQLAALIDEHRDLQNAAWLQEAADIIDADYIMIYDTNGDEVISSARYRGMSLGKEEGSATYDFRRLLRGVRDISHAGVRDEVTGLTRDMHGISLRYLSNERSYGALIIAVDPDKHSSAVFSDIEETASAMAPVAGFISGVDPETGIVKYSSDSSMRGASMHEICRELEEYEGSFMGFADIAGTDYYMRSAEYGGVVYYCGITQAEMFRHVLTRAYRMSYRFLVLAAILALILFAGYDQQTFNDLAEKKVDASGRRIKLKSRGTARDASSISGDRSREQTAFMRRSYFSFMDEELSPGERVKNVLQFLILIFTAIIGLFILLDKSGATGTTGSDDVIDYIAHGDWDRGFNLFSIAAIIFLISILVVGLYILRTIAGLLYMTMDTKARTTSMLIINICHYAAIIVVVFFSMGLLGVDTRALVASAGLAGIAITLGARDLIADIIAGIMILVDNTYQIGEIVSLNGFRGEIAEIGMRSTRIIGRGDNVKTIRNSTIGDVINYSRLNSWYPLTLTVKSSEDLSALEKMLGEELPKIGKSYPDMLSGPEYRGVDSISGDKTTILILTECKEEDYNQVQRDVNREVRHLFKVHNIELF